MRKRKERKPGEYRVSAMNEWDFLVAFTNYFGLRRGAEIIGTVLLWRVSGLAPMVGAISINQLAEKMKERGISSRAATYRAMVDLREFAEHFEDEGLTVAEIVDRLGEVDVSRMGDKVVQ